MFVNLDRTDRFKKFKKRSGVENSASSTISGAELTTLLKERLEIYGNWRMYPYLENAK